MPLPSCLFTCRELLGNICLLANLIKSTEVQMENMSIAQPGLAGAQGARAAHPTRSRQTDGVSEWQSCIPFCSKRESKKPYRWDFQTREATHAFVGHLLKTCNGLHRSRQKTCGRSRNGGKLLRTPSQHPSTFSLVQNASWC